MLALFHIPIPILEAMKMPKAKAADNEVCNKLKRLLAWDEKKVKPMLVVVRRAMKGGKTIQFEDDRPWSSADRRTRRAPAKNTKGRAVLRVDGVKDECGHRAVFEEQGAAASQMAAAEVPGHGLKVSWYVWRGL